jgi:hypothetical protein
MTPMHKRGIKSVLIEGEIILADENGNVDVPDGAVNQLLNSGYVVGHLFPETQSDEEPPRDAIQAEAEPAKTVEPANAGDPVAEPPTPPVKKKA